MRRSVFSTTYYNVFLEMDEIKALMFASSMRIEKRILLNTEFWIFSQREKSQGVRLGSRGGQETLPPRPIQRLTIC